MGNTYRVQVLHFSNILEIEGARATRDFEALLDAMEYGNQSGLSDDEKREMCILSLQDLEPEEAAYQVLKHDMADLLRDGQMRNAAGEMQDEKLWEEYSNSNLHERFFNAGSLLYAALPKSFPKPDAVRLELEVMTAGAGAKHLLKNVNNETFLVRLLADGMDDHAILHRLYGDQLSGKSFPNAAEVVWTVRAEPAGEDIVRLEVISSGYWLDALERTKSYETTAYADEI